MNYNIFTRPRLPRNRYGYDNLNQNGIYSSNSIYGSSEAAAKVGADMESLDTFTGATFNTDGQKGLVPAPLRGQQDYFIKGDGAWTDIPAYRWMSEFPADEELEKRGLQVNGDLNVTDTLNTFNLNVEGQAHFWELVIDKAKMQGGQIFVSPSLFQIDFIETSPYVYPIDDTVECWMHIHNERPDIWQFVEERGFAECKCARLWMRNDDGSDHTANEVQIGDMMRCRTFNLDGEYTVTHEYKDVSNTDYHSFVLNRGEGTFTDEDGNEHSGFWIDLVYSIKEVRQTRSRAANVKNYSLDTYFEVGRDPDPKVITQDLWDELKLVAFQTLCGREDVESDTVDFEDLMDEVTGLDFDIRGVDYIMSLVIGDDFSDEEVNSLYSSNRAADISEEILYGSEERQSTNLINEIAGTTSYDEVDNDNEYYVQRAAARAAGTQTQGDSNVEEESEPELFSGSYTPDSRNHWLFGYGIFNPKVGQQLGCLGHMWDKSRQNAIVISAINPIDPELVAPSIAQYVGIDTFGVSISNFRVNVIAKNGSVFKGKFMVNNNGVMMKVDDMIQLYINDIETGLETVGIHLDGENSTIKMVGNVELHQHSDKPNDTLSVFNSDEIIKVQIKPTEIPSLSDIGMTTTDNYKGSNSGSTFYIYNDNSQGYDQIQRSHETSGGVFGIGSTDYYKYRISWLHPYNLSMTNDVYIGTYKQGTTVDINNLTLHIDLGMTRFRDYGDINLPLHTAGPVSTSGATPNTNILTYTIEVQRAMLSTGLLFYETIYQHQDITTLTPNMNKLDVNLGDVLENYDIQNSSARKYRIKVSVSFYVRTNDAPRITSKYSGNDMWFKVSPKMYLSCDVYSITKGDSFMQIGTNGMVYSTGTGDYFYSGNDGIEMKNNQSGLLLTNEGMHLYRKPQTINSNDTDKTVTNEFVICQAAGSGYTVTLSNNYIIGQTITIVGFSGLRINSPSTKKINVYRFDIGTWSYVDYVLMTSSTGFISPSAGLGGSDVPYLNVNKALINLTVGPDAIYIQI